MKFLLIRLSSLGDIIHSLPIIYRIRQKYPDAQVDWLTGNKGLELLSLIKEINNVYLLNLENLSLIQKQKYDYVIDVQGLFKSALLSKMCLGKKVIGFKNTREFADIFYDEKIDVGNLFKTKKHIVDMNLELVETRLIASLPRVDVFCLDEGPLDKKIKFLIPKISETNKGLLQQTLFSNTTENKKKVIIFPSTTWESKLWSMDYWFELIKMMSSDFQIYLCASRSDLCFIKSLIDKLDSSKISYINLVGKTNLNDLIYLIQNVDLVIGLDSAGLHLASAVKNDYETPEVIGIYGPTSPFRSGPYTSFENTLYLSEMECIACRKKKCPLGHHKCMNDILPADLMNMIDRKTKL